MSIYIFACVILIFFIIAYVAKKEILESFENNTSSSQKYTIKEISFAVQALLLSLQYKYSLVKVTTVTRNGAFIDYECMLYNHDKPSVQNFKTKVKIPLNSSGKYMVVNSTMMGSTDSIKNGVRQIQESQHYENLRTKS